MELFKICPDDSSGKKALYSKIVICNLLNSFGIKDIDPFKLQDSDQLIYLSGGKDNMKNEALIWKSVVSSFTFHFNILAGSIEDTIVASDNPTVYDAIDFAINILSDPEASFYNKEVSDNADENFWSNREFVLKAVNSDGDLLEYADAKFKADREVVLAAVSSSSLYSLYLADPKFNTDREVVLETVKHNPGQLKYASDELKADREIVLAAVISEGLALQYASKELKADREIVLAAVKSHRFALAYASKELKAELRE